MIRTKLNVMEFVLSLNTLTNDVQIIEGKIIKTIKKVTLTGKVTLSWREVRVIEGEITVNAWCN